jgi:hypothetical protein
MRENEKDLITHIYVKKVFTIVVLFFSLNFTA